MTMTTEHETGDELANQGLDQPIDTTATVVETGVVEVITNDAEVEVHAGTAAVEQASEAFLMPGVAGRDEFLSLAMQARVLSLSGAAPKAIRNNPHIALHVAMIGRDLGISPSAAMELIDVMGDGTNDETRITLSPQLLNGQIRRLGLGRIARGKVTTTECEAIALDPDGNELGRGTFTWEDAQIAGLVDVRCPDPLHHWKKDPPSGDWKKDKCRCRGGWKSYPKRMLWWRASGFVADDFFPEAGLGLYTAEELGAVVDKDGRPLDASTVDLPPGYEVSELTPTADVEEPADPGIIAGLRGRLADLPADEAAFLREKWKERNFPPVDQLTRRQTSFVDALINASEARAKKAGWTPSVPADPETGEMPESTETAPGSPTAASEAQEAVSAPETPEEAPQATTASDTELEAVPSPLVDAAIASVQMLPNAAIDPALEQRGLSKSGTYPTRRARLARAMAIEAHQGVEIDAPY